MDSIILKACGITIAVLIVFLIVALLIRLIRFLGKKEICCDAELISKTQTDMSIIKSVSLDADRNANVLMFDANGEKVDFLVSKWVYGSVEVGMKGKLTYRDGFFIKFVPDEAENYNAEDDNTEDDNTEEVTE